MWRRMKITKWVDKVSNKEVLNKVKEKRMLLNTIVKMTRDWIGHVIREEEINSCDWGNNGRRRKKFKLVDTVKRGGYERIKEKTKDRSSWRYSGIQDLPTSRIPCDDEEN